MENLKSYTNFLPKFFEECELKNASWDTQDDNLWLATFEPKSGQVRQYKTNLLAMEAWCNKVHHSGFVCENRDFLVRFWKLYSMNLYTREYNLNHLLNQLKPKEFKKETML